MRAQWIGLFVSIAISIVTGCSNVGFQSMPKLSCDSVSAAQDTACQLVGDTLFYDLSFKTGEVDILFVDDNSGSMWSQQQKMANAFPNFFSAIKGLFYQIGIITTGVSSSGVSANATNGNGAFLDGQLLEFHGTSGTASGLKVIDPSTANGEDLFKGTIQRKETLNCLNSNFAASSCPADDERGIYALNMAVDRNESGFFRPGAHLAVVILTNEDERSQGGVDYHDGNTPDPLETYDLPQTFVTKMAGLFPSKSISVHSVVTNNSACMKSLFNISNSGVVTFGYIGYQYMDLAQPTSALLGLGNIMPGVVGSICASDYGAQLGNIAQEVTNNTKVSPKQLPCNPDKTKISITTTPAQYANQVQYSINAQNQVTFTNVPTGIQVTFSYACPRF